MILVDRLSTRTLLSGLLLSLIACNKNTPTPMPSDDPTPIIVSPEASPPASPDLSDVVALEVIVEPDPRRSTRDPELVQAVLAPLGGAAVQWAESSVPRCMPVLWIRFVSAAAEDSITALFCRPGGPAYFWVPGTGGLQLDEASSRALYAAARPLENVDGGPIPPTAVTENLETFEIFLGVRGKDSGLISLFLFAHGISEPETQWSDGSPASKSLPIDAEQAKLLVTALQDTGFFSRSIRVHSNAVKIPTTLPPSGSTDGFPQNHQERTHWVSATVMADEWHRTWHEESEQVMFEHTLEGIQRLPLDPQVLAALEELGR